MGRLPGGLRVLALALLPIVLVLSHRNLTVVAGLIALTGAGALARDIRAMRLPGWARFALALAAYLAMSSLWTPNIGDRDWAYRIPVFVLTIIGVVAAGQGGTDGTRIGRAFGLAVLIGCLLLGIEGATGGLIRDLVPPPNAPDRDDVSTARGVGLAIAMLPAAGWWLVRAYAARGWWLTGAAAVCVGVGALRFGVAANVLVLAASGAVAGLAWLAPRRTLRGCFYALAAGFVVAPIAASLLPPTETLEALDQGPVSWRQRLVIWRTVADAALADPGIFLFGAGQQASAALGEAAGTMELAGSPVPLPRVPTHPHDVFLQVWYEAGALGCALAAASLLSAARNLRWTASSPGIAIALAATLAGASVSLTVDASLWTLWRWSALLLAAYGLILAARVTDASSLRWAVSAARIGRTVVPAAPNQL